MQLRRSLLIKKVRCEAQGCIHKKRHMHLSATGYSLSAPASYYLFLSQLSLFIAIIGNEKQFVNEKKHYILTNLKKSFIDLSILLYYSSSTDKNLT